MRQPGNWMASMSMLAKNPELVAALARRQITDLKKVHMEPWPTGPTGKTFRDAPYDYAELEPASVRELGKFSAYVHMWYRHDELDNCYAHPIDGLKVVVDCGSLEVLEVEDQDDTIPIPMEENNYVHQRLPAENPKHAPRPIQITQPEGATFAVDGGNKLSWMGWDMVVGFNAREGLTLHQVRPRD
jgi:primary-amine oxidase